DVGLASRLDPRQFEFVAEDRGQFFERDIDFEDVSARIAAGLPFARLLPVAAGDRSADFAIPLADAPRAVLAVADMGHVELGNRNADQIATLTADHLAVGDVLPQIL